MPRERVIDFLPEVYHDLLPELFERPLAEERHATCENCVMCPPAAPELPPEAYYSPTTKCCTYHPTLPNYAVGGLLQDGSDAGREGRRRIDEAIDRRVGVTPFGIRPPARTLVLQRNGKAGFGRADSLRCPYFDQAAGGCTVWAQREAVCATWFCKHNHGLDGREFWAGLRDYLVGVQRVLIAYVLRELGFDARAIAAGFPPHDNLDARDLDGAPPSDDEYARQWGAWRNRERELYVRSQELVLDLDRARYAALAGLRGELELGLLAGRYDAIARPQLPRVLLKNPAMRVDRGRDGTYVLTSYANGEPTRLRGPVFAMLDVFDGRRPVEEARRIAAQAGFRIGDSFLIALWHHRILVDPRALDRPGTRLLG